MMNVILSSLDRELESKLDILNTNINVYNLEVYSTDGYWVLHYQNEEEQDIILASISHLLVLESSLCGWVEDYIPLIKARIPVKKRRRTNDSKHTNIESNVTYVFQSTG